MPPKHIRAVVDRIEGRHAVLEVGGKYNVLWPARALPREAADNSILDVCISVDKEAEKKQRAKIKRLKEKLKNR